MPIAPLVQQFETLADKIRERTSAPSAVLVLALFAVISFVGFNRELDRDLFARIAMGRLIAVGDHFPTTDPFAFSPKKEMWVDHEWLSGVVFYHLTQFGGEAGLIVFKFLVLTSSICLLWKATRSQHEVGPPLLWFLLCSMATSYVWMTTVRSQVFTYLFIPVVFLGIEGCKRRKLWPLIILPIVFVFWANAHGGFVLGLASIGLFSIGLVFDKERRKEISRMLLLFLLCLLGTFINPYPDFVYWRYILEAVAMPRPSITEWAPLPLFALDSLLPLFIIAVSVAGAIVARRRPRLSELLLLLFAICGVFRAMRLIAFLAMAACVYGSPLYREFADWLKGILFERYMIIRRSVYVSMTLLVLVGVVAFVRSISSKGDPNRALKNIPSESIEWLRTNGSGGRLLVDFNNGSYALWRLYPKYSISLDGRYEEVYPQSTVEAVSVALDPASPDHLENFSSLTPDYAIFLNKDRERFLSLHREWCLILVEGDYSLLGLGVKGCGAKAPATVMPKSLWDPLF